MNILEQFQTGLEQGTISQAEVEELVKSISAGYGYAGKPTDLTYGGVIQMESLEATLKSVTFDMKTLQFWPAVSIDKANNLVEQYNRLLAYGSDSAPYMAEGGAPQEDDSQYARVAQRIAFFGTRRKVTHQITLVQTTTGDVVAQQAKEGTMHILGKVEREMYWGNAHFINPTTGVWDGSMNDVPTNSISMNGLLQQLQSGNNDFQTKSGDFDGYGEFGEIGIDLAGLTFTQDDIEQLAVVCLENFGSPDQFHVEPLVLSSFVRKFYPQFRSEPGKENQTVGYDVDKIVTTAGRIAFKPNLFLRPRGLARAQAVNSNAPTIVVGATANGIGGGSLVPATYQYKLTAVNDFGEGAPVAANRVVGAGENSVQITITSATAGTKYIKLYRTIAGGAVNTEKFVGNYKFTGNGMTIQDLGKKLPGLGEAFLLNMNAENIRFKQLLPLTKINFAIVTTAMEFAIVLYGALFAFTPRFNAYFYNAGK